MNDITIVTAFFDIGRSDWTPDKGLPHYLHRTTETYFERFGYMAKLENKIIVYCAKEHVKDIKLLRQDRPTEILVVDFPNSFQELRNAVSIVQKNPDYLKKINLNQVRNPEYWSADYVVVNALKSTFVNRAIQLGYVETDLVAWLDFGYCRESSTTNGVTHWQYPFNKDKIHFFNVRDYKEGTFIQDIIANNTLHMHGSMIVAGKEIQSMAADLSELWGSVAKLTYISAEKPSTNIFSNKSAEQIAIERYTAKAEAHELALKAKNLFVGHYGLAAWDQIQKEVIGIRKEMERQKYEEEKANAERMENIQETVVVSIIVMFVLSIMIAVGIILSGV